VGSSGIRGLSRKRGCLRYIIIPLIIFDVGCRFYGKMYVSTIAFECDTDNGPVYRRTALVIWPKWGSLGRMKRGDRRAAYALEMLKASSSLEPTSEELDLFNYVSKSAANISKPDLVKALCPNARKWGKVYDWLAIVKRCIGKKVSSLFSAKEATAAVSAFGFPSVAPT
jgi:hypothetical protein